MEIRKETAQDAAFIKEHLLHENGNSGHEVKTSRERMEAIYAQTAATGAYHLVLADGDEIKGWVLFGERPDYFSGTIHGYIYDLFVFAAARGNGYGKMLLAAAADELRGRGLSEVRLNVFEGNPARYLYEKSGYETYSRIMRMPL